MDKMPPLSFGTSHSEPTSSRIPSYFWKPLAAHSLSIKFTHVPQFPRPDIRQIVRPNADTLYSTAWLDLAKEPILIHLPDSGDAFTCCNSWMRGQKPSLNSTRMARRNSSVASCACPSETRGHCRR